MPRLALLSLAAALLACDPSLPIPCGASETGTGSTGMPADTSTDTGDAGESDSDTGTSFGVESETAGPWLDTGTEDTAGPGEGWCCWCEDGAEVCEWATPPGCEARAAATGIKSEWCSPLTCGLVCG